jgi:hypothetical protein
MAALRLPRERALEALALMRREGLSISDSSPRGRRKPIIPLRAGGTIEPKRDLHVDRQ